MPPLLTVGHGTLDRDELGALLRGDGIALVVDVRRFPASRRNADVAREALAAWLPGLGIGYRWEPGLGGRRPVQRPVEDSWWTVPAFAAYAAYSRTAEFAAALQPVLEAARVQRTVVMCSESLWWRCHRRLIADVAVLGHGSEVRHLMHDGRLAPHRPAAGARVRADGSVVWDGGASNSRRAALSDGRGGDRQSGWGDDPQGGGREAEGES